MIGKLTGRIDYKGRDHVLLEVGGVGYVVHVSERTLAALPGKGEVAALYTDLLVREDLLQLFGFPSLLEREWHRLLTTVQGVGAKAALSILSTLGPDGVARAISLGDWGSVKAAQGVGPKLAQRVVNELKSKAPEVMALCGTLAEALIETDVPGTPAPGPAAAKPAPAAPTAAGDQAAALSALVNLGYGPADASTAVAQAAADGAAGEPAQIPAALRLLAPKG